MRRRHRSTVHHSAVITIVISRREDIDPWSEKVDARAAKRESRDTVSARIGSTNRYSSLDLCGRRCTCIGNLVLIVDIARRYRENEPFLESSFHHFVQLR